jgi:hypothetical protein
MLRMLAVLALSSTALVACKNSGLERARGL